jgi:DNA primase
MITISSEVLLEKRNNNYFGKCPVHNEKHISLMVSPKKNEIHCFGCGFNDKLSNHRFEKKLNRVHIIKKLY